MSTEVRWRKGTTAEHASFTGALGEVTVDTTKKTLVVHDGTTVGGFPLQTAGGGGSGTVEFSPPVTLPVSANMNMASTTSNLVNVTGSGTINTLGVAANGVIRYLTFQGVVTLTHNAVSLNLLTGASIKTAAGDLGIFQSNGGNSWKLISYVRASGKPLAGSSYEVNVRDYGAKGDGVADDTAAFLAVRDVLQSLGNDYQGGVMRIPAGQYKLSQEIAFTKGSGDLVSIIVQGDGPNNTSLEFGTALVGTNGLSFSSGAHFAVKDMTITNAPQHGIMFARGSLQGGPFSAYFQLENLRIQHSGVDGVRCYSAFMGSIENVWAAASGAYGFNFGGFSTSLTAKTSFASNSQLSGWKLNGIIYSSLVSCASDTNLFHGFELSNCTAVAFLGCGTEGNKRSGWHLSTANSTAVDFHGSVQDIRGVTFSSCYALTNSFDNTATYANFIHAVTADNRPIEILITGGKIFSETGRAFTLQGTSGQITVATNMLDLSQSGGTDSISGSVTVQNQSVAGKAAYFGLSVASQNISDSLETAVQLTPNSAESTLTMTTNGTSVTIPKGVNRVRVHGCVRYSSNVNGIRQLYVKKNGNAIPGAPLMNMNGASVSVTTVPITSAPLRVVAGDVLSLTTAQYSGAALTIAQGNDTYFVIEALG